MPQSKYSFINEFKDCKITGSVNVLHILKATVQCTVYILKATKKMWTCSNWKGKASSRVPVSVLPLQQNSSKGGGGVFILCLYFSPPFSLKVTLRFHPQTARCDLCVAKYSGYFSALASLGRAGFDTGDLTPYPAMLPFIDCLPTSLATPSQSPLMVFAHAADPSVLESSRVHLLPTVTLLISSSPMSLNAICILMAPTFLPPVQPPP